MPWLEKLFASDDFHSALGLAAQARHQLEKRTERATRVVLHQLNLPAGSDVTRILAEAGRLYGELRQLSVELAGMRGDMTRIVEELAWVLSELERLSAELAHVREQ